jgi:hypothetical protein
MPKQGRTWKGAFSSLSALTPSRSLAARSSPVRPSSTVRTVKTGTRLSLKRPENANDGHLLEFERVVVWDSCRLFSALMVFGMMLVCKFYTRGAELSGVCEGLDILLANNRDAREEGGRLRNNPARQQLGARLEETPRLRWADEFVEFNLDVKRAIRQILRALVPDSVIPAGARVVGANRPVAAVEGFLAEPANAAFIAGVQDFFDAIPAHDGRPGLPAVGVLPHWWLLLNHAAAKITTAFENNLAHPFTGRVEDALNTITRDKAAVQYAIHVGLGTKDKPRGRVPLLSVPALRLMEEVLTSMDWGGRLMRVTARKEFTEALLQDAAMQQDEPRAAAVVEAMVEAVFQDVARARGGGAGRAAGRRAVGRPAAGRPAAGRAGAAGAAARGPAAGVGAAGAAAADAVGAVYPDAEGVPADMQPVWKAKKAALAASVTGIVDALPLSADVIKSSRIFSSLDTQVMLLQRLVVHNTSVDGREAERELRLRQVAAVPAWEGGPRDLNQLYPHLVRDGVRDTKVSTFTIGPIGGDDGGH